jgi:hypothetical protein
MLTPYEQFHIQALHQKGMLIPELYTGDLNPLFQLAIHPPFTTWQGQSCSIPLPGRTPCYPAPDSDSQPPRYVRFYIHLNNILNIHTTTSNPLTLTLLTLHTIDTFYPLLSLGTHTHNIVTTKLRTYIMLLNTNYIFSLLQHCTP